MKLLIFTDAHIRASTPRSRIDDYPVAMWEKFLQISKIIEDRGIDTVLMGGDLFDSPDPSTSVVNSYLNMFTYWQIPIYSIVGSHDKFGYNDDTLYRTALGTLIASSTVTLLGATTVIGRNTQIAGISHSYDLDENSEVDYYRGKIDPTAYLVEVVHGMTVDGPWGFGKHTNVNDIRTEADLLICGHYHPGFKPVQVGNTTIVNVGALGRTENVQRVYPPGIIIVDTSLQGKETWEFIPLNVPDDVFGTREVKAEEVFGDLDVFIQLLKDKSGDIEYGNIKELVTMMGQKGKYPENVIMKALEYVE